MVTGITLPPESIVAEEYAGLEAAHIFPHARESEWRRLGYNTLVTDPAPSNKIGSSKIHSPQNGLFLRADIHQLFDSAAFSIDVDDGYRVVSFKQDIFGIDGNILHNKCRNPQDPLHIQDEFLLWHYRAAVLASMKGPAQAPWEHDFPDGDMIGEIMESSDAAERMEVELFTRLSVRT